MEDISALEEKKEAIRVQSPESSNKSPGPTTISYRQDVKVMAHVNLEGERGPQTLCGICSLLRKNEILKAERGITAPNTANDALLSESEEP